MAKDVESVDTNIKIGINSNELQKTISAIRDASKEATNNLDKLSKGFRSVLNNQKAAAQVVNSEITSAAKELKSLNSQLKLISTASAGTNALRNQAAVRGVKTGLLYGDNKAFTAQLKQATLLREELIRVNSAYRNFAKIANVTYHEAMNTIAAKRQAEKVFRENIDYRTSEGGLARKYKRNRYAERVQETASDQLAIQTGRTTATALNDLKQMEGLDRRLGVIQLKLMANYKAINMVTGAFKYLLNYTVEYDRELHQLQAIAAVSDTTMLKLKDSIQAVASSTKFTSLEVAQAGTVLAQAGLSARQIETTLPAIAKLATATGTDLATSTDVVTSTLNIYSLQASEAEHVTNALTTAMNESKADIAGFQKAIQYAGNYAAQLGVTYEETAAVISAATQAGIRSRSMLGTGLRAVLAEFLNPTKKLVAQLEKVGLTVSDIDVKSKGLTNVLKTLKESGFGATEAFRGMERRGAAFLASIINQTEFIDTLRSHMAASTAAIEANEIQMGSLSAQIANFRSIAGTVASDGIAPLNKAMTALLKIVNDLISGGAAKGGKPSKTGGVIMSALFGAAGAASIVTSLAMVGGAIATMANQIKMLEKAAEAKGIMKLFTFLASWKGTAIIAGIGAVIGTVSYLGEKLGWFTSEADKARAAIEKMNGDYEEAKEKGDSVAAMLQRLYDQQEKLQSQSERDVFLQEILTRFPEAAQFVDKLTLSFTELEEVLIRLNNLEVGKVAEESAKKAKGMVKENDAIIREYGRKTFKFEGAKTEGFFGKVIRYSEDAEKMFQKMEQIEYFKNFDFKRLRELNRADNAPEWKLEENAKELANTIMEGFRSYFKDLNDPTAILRQVGTLRNAGASLQDENLKYFIEKVAAEQTQMATSMINANEKLMDDLKTQHASEITALSDDSQKFFNKLADDQKKVNEELKTSIIKNTDSAKTFVESYLKELKARLDKEQDMGYLKDEEGNRKPLTSYSYEEIAKLVGKESTEENINSIKSEIDKLSKEFHGDTEKAYQAYVDNASGRTQQLNIIAKEEEAIKEAILALPYGQQRYGEFTGEAYRKAVDEGMKNLYKAKNANQAQESFANIKLNALGMYQASILNRIPGTNNNLFRTELEKAGTLDLATVSKAYKNAYGKDITTEKDFSGIQSDVLSFEGEMNRLNTTLQSVTNTFSKIRPEIPAISSEMTNLFHKINIDIKQLDTAYTNTTRSMDQMLARQQGIITGLERVYGSGSAIVEAAQIRLQKLEESQLGERTAALQTQLAGYIKARQELISSPEYLKAQSKHNEAEAIWRNALAGGNQKDIMRTKASLDNIDKSWDKLAGEEKTLASKIASLEDEIAKNTEAIKSEERERALEREQPTGQVARGFGDAATKYLEANKEYTTFRGMGSKFAGGFIDSVDNGLLTFLDNVTTKSMSAKESFKEFGRSIIKTIGDIAKELLVKKVVSELLGGLFSSSGGVISESSGGTASGYTDSALGGLVTGPIKNRDSVPTMLMPGEYVLKKSAVDSLGRDYLDSLNNKSSSYMSGYSSEVTEAKTENDSGEGQAKGGVVNVYVVGQEQQQQMTPQDVVVTITQDMITGGQTKKLVKSIAMGAI